MHTLGEKDADDVALADQVRALLSILHVPGLDELLDECRPLESPGERLSVGYLECVNCRFA